MYELMQASLMRLERENNREVARELRRRRVWLVGVSRRQPSVDEETQGERVPASVENPVRLTRKRAVLNLIRLSIE